MFSGVQHDRAPGRRRPQVPAQRLAFGLVRTHLFGAVQPRTQEHKTGRRQPNRCRACAVWLDASVYMGNGWLGCAVIRLMFVLRLALGCPNPILRKRRTLPTLERKSSMLGLQLFACSFHSALLQLGCLRWGRMGYGRRVHRTLAPPVCTCLATVRLQRPFVQVPRFSQLCVLKSPARPP